MWNKYWNFNYHCSPWLSSLTQKDVYRLVRYVIPSTPVPEVACSVSPNVSCNPQTLKILEAHTHKHFHGKWCYTMITVHLLKHWGKSSNDYIFGTELEYLGTFLLSMPCQCLPCSVKSHESYTRVCTGSCVPGLDYEKYFQPLSLLKKPQLAGLTCEDHSSSPFCLMYL